MTEHACPEIFQLTSGEVPSRHLSSTCIRDGFFDPPMRSNPGRMEWSIEGSFHGIKTETCQWLARQADDVRGFERARGGMWNNPLLVKAYGSTESSLRRA